MEDLSQRNTSEQFKQVQVIFEGTTVLRKLLIEKLNSSLLTQLILTKLYTNLTRTNGYELIRCIYWVPFHTIFQLKASNQIVLNIDIRFLWAGEQVLKSGCFSNFDRCSRQNALGNTFLAVFLLLRVGHYYTYAS